MSQNPKEPSDEAAPQRDERDDLDRQIAVALRVTRRSPAIPARSGAEPDDETLLRVIDGTANAEERRAVDEAGAYTRDRLEILRGALAEVEPVSAQVARAARYVFAVARDSFDFLRGATAPLGAPQLAMVTRSTGAAEIDPAAVKSEPFFEFRQDFADIEAQIRIEHVTRPAHAVRPETSLDVQVRLVGTGGSPAGNGRVTIRRAGRTLDSTPLAADGSATFTNLVPDRYELELRTTGKVVGVVLLDFLS